MRHAAANSSSPEALVPIETLMTEATKFMSRERGEAVMRKWLPRHDRDIQDMPENRVIAMMADAVLLSADLLLSQPSASGATAFDRLARRYGDAAPAEKAALIALRQARFRLLRLERDFAEGEICARDVLSDEALRLAPTLPPLAAGIILFCRVAALGGNLCCLAGAVTPLDPAAFAVAGRHPAAGAPGAAANARWAEAVYAHVVRHGTLDVPGVNRLAGDLDEGEIFADGDDPLLELAMAWAALTQNEPDAALLQRTRQSADLPTILDALAAAVMSRDAGRQEIADALERLLFVQLETVQRRESSGAGALTLDVVARALDGRIAADEWPTRVRTLFTTLRQRISRGQRAGDPALEQLVQRIQALRSKTVAQGCTEQEALAAAEKVAELLDRYGLSLGELEFRAQPCAGIGIQTNRRRIAPIDSCVPAIAAFFDCRVWAERAQGTALRYIFFGLRGDVAAAQYLYEMVERAFETETNVFRASDIYFEMAGERRSATNSFQIGLARGISDKLHALRAARDAGARSASGRDLVPMKAAIVDEEMQKLGLNLSSRILGRGKRVLTDAFAAGEVAGQQFEFAPAITQAA